MVVLCLSVVARGQSVLNPDDTTRATALFSAGTRAERLNCEIEPRKPFLDFAFRFDGGYTVHCPLKAFGGTESALYTFVRVTPRGGAPVLLGTKTRLPAISAAQASRNSPRKMRNVVEISGGFSIGEGEYLVEAVVADDRDRASRKRWTIKAYRTGAERAVPLKIKASSVTDMGFHPWRGCSRPASEGEQLTVLLDAAPISPREVNLRAWDRVFLLATLSSLLDQTPCRSVKLIAFNLDQQREVFRKEEFDGPGFFELERALEHLELGTVSYRTLQQHQGWAELLAGYTNREVLAEQPADAVIFLGPAMHILEKIPAGMLRARETAKPQFFCFEYLPNWRRGAEFDDAIAALTKARDGAVFRIHSPAELALAVQKMLKRVRPAGQPAAPGSWPARPGPKP